MILKQYPASILVGTKTFMHPTTAKQNVTQVQRAEKQNAVTRMHTHSPRKKFLMHERVQNQFMPIPNKPSPLKSQMITPKNTKTRLEN